MHCVWILLYTLYSIKSFVLDIQWYNSDIIDIIVVQVLFNVTYNNYILQERWTALHLASYNGQTDIVQLLLQSNANPNICDDKVST